MEFTSTQEVYKKALGEPKLSLINLKMGSNCTEYLFKNNNITFWNFYTGEVYDFDRIVNENSVPQFLETNI